MSIIFNLNENGKVTLYPFGITNGSDVIPCKSEDYANNLLANSRYDGYNIINSAIPSDKLIQTLKGVRFDSYDDAEQFINGGGYKESPSLKIKSLVEENKQLSEMVDSLGSMIIMITNEM